MPDPRGAVAAGRRAAESLMLDAGKALRPTGETAFDPFEQADVDEVLPVFGSDADPVPCKIKPPRTVAPRDVEVGGRTAAIIPGELHLPAEPECAGLTVGDLWEVVAVDPQSLSQVGRRYRITSETDGTLLTACRYTIERVVS